MRTKKLVIEPTEAAFVRQMYEMYADPQVSLHDITKKLTADGMRTYHGRPLSRATLSVILRNPIYVMADLDIYEFYKSQGTDIYNDAADFAGTNGCYYYQGKGNTEDKHKHLQGQTLVLAPHEGFIPSELWLKCRKKLLASHTYQRKESPEHMDGGKNQMREMRLCAHVGALQRYSLPALHRPC